MARSASRWAFTRRPRSRSRTRPTDYRDRASAFRRVKWRRGGLSRDRVADGLGVDLGTTYRPPPVARRRVESFSLGTAAAADPLRRAARGRRGTVGEGRGRRATANRRGPPASSERRLGDLPPIVVGEPVSRRGPHGPRAARDRGPGHRARGHAPGHIVLTHRAKSTRSSDRLAGAVAGGGLGAIRCRCATTPGGGDQLRRPAAGRDGRRRRGRRLRWRDVDAAVVRKTPSVFEIVGVPRESSASANDIDAANLADVDTRWTASWRARSVRPGRAQRPVPAARRVPPARRPCPPTRTRRSVSVPGLQTEDRLTAPS